MVQTKLDKKFVPLALKLLNKHGAVATVSIKSGDTFNPSTNKRAAGTSTPHSVKIVPPFPYKDVLIDGDNIKRGDMQTYFAASGLGFDPLTARYTLDFKGTTWKVETTQPFYSGEQIALYGVQLRRR